MYNYDIKNHIKIENRNKLYGEVSIIIVILVVILCIMYTSGIRNPFNITTPSTDTQIEEAYKSQDKYVQFQDVKLVYTGYYKENKRGEALYNCYKLKVDKLEYFVFVSVENSGENPESPDNILENYTVNGKIEKDFELLQIAAKDYGLTVEEFIKEYKVSPIIINEARSDRQQIIVTWFMYGLLILGCLVYIIGSLYRQKNILWRKEIRELGTREEVEEIFEDINREVEYDILFDSNRLKLTKSWLIAFFDGTIIIIKFSDIIKFEEVNKVKKSYGIAKIGYRNFISIRCKNGDEHEILIENIEEYTEVLEILKKIVKMEVKA